MDFALTEEQTAIFDMARDFAMDRIAPYARDWEAAGTIPKELWPEIAALGFGGLYVREESGGSGLSRLDATLVFEALSMACPATAAFLSIHNMCAKMIDAFGSDEMRGRFLPGALSMETVFSYCLTEPGSGSDAAALKTRATRTNEGYSLTGTKAFISGGGYSDAYIVMCRTGEDGPKGISAMVVEDGTDGLSFGGLEDKMGWKAQPTRQVQLDECHIPAANLLGEEGRGFSYAMAGLDGGRLNISACSLGAAQSALDATLQYMSERKAFGTADQTSSRRCSSGWPSMETRASGRPHLPAPGRVETGYRRTMTPPSSAPWPNADGHRHRLCNVANRLPAAARRLRLPGRLRRREDRARLAGASDPGRHQRDHAPDCRPPADCGVTRAQTDGAPRMSDIHIRKSGRRPAASPLTRPKALNAMSL